LSETENVIPVYAEELSVAKRQVRTGQIRVETRTEVVEEIVNAEIETSSVEVEHVPVGRVVDCAPEIRTEGDVTIVPVLEEVLVIEKRLVLREELHIKRLRTTESVEIPVSVRKQRAEVSRTTKPGAELIQEEQDND
jgi:stress response protein YsnF